MPAVLVGIATLPACSDPQGSACIAGGACERVLLDHCTCCGGFEATECRQDRQEKCGGGNLVVPWVPSECEVMRDRWAEVKAGGTDPCSLLTDEEREQACTNFLTEGLPDEPRQQEPQTF